MMKRIAVTAATLALGAMSALGLAAPAHAAPQTSQTKSEVAAQCGLNRTTQQYYNCANHPQYVQFMYYDSIGRTWGTAAVCLPQGRTSVFSAIGPYRVAWTASPLRGC